MGRSRSWNATGKRSGEILNSRQCRQCDPGNEGKKHRPADDFERSAVSALRAGAPEYHEIEDGRFRFVKSIRIQNECLKCHVPYRTSLEDRIGGIAFSFPFPFLAEPLSTTSLEATESAATDAGGSR